MIPELIIAAIAIVAIYVVWKILIRLVVVALALGVVVLFLNGKPELSGRIWELVNAGFETAIEYGTSVVERLG